MNSDPSSDPVVIVGAGPTGLMLACELGLVGVPAVVLERLEEPPEWSRALALQARSVEVLQQRGLDWFDEYPHVRSYNFGLLMVSDLIEPHLIPRLVPQLHVEQRLEEHARALGVDIRRGHEVTGLAQDESGVTLTVETGGGGYTLRGQYVVGCDGGSSAVRKLAGIGFPGTASTVNGLTADVRIPDGSQERVPPTLFPRGFFAAIPLEPGLYRVTAAEMGVEPPDRGQPATVEEFREVIRRVADRDVDLSDTSWLSRFGDATRLAERYRQGRVLLAGDSAHIHFPVSGQGLNTGLQDAVNLGWKLAATVRGWAPEGLLDTYHAERYPVGRLVCMNTRAQVALMHPLDRVAPLRELFGELLHIKQVTNHLINMVTGLGLRYDYDGEDLPVPDRHPLLGARLPDLPLTTPDGTTSTFAALRGGRGLLLDLSGDAGYGDTAAAEVLGWADRVDVVRATAVPEVEAAALLVRPDGHVAFVDPHGKDAEGLRPALVRWFGEPRAVAQRR